MSSHVVNRTHLLLKIRFNDCFLIVIIYLLFKTFNVRSPFNVRPEIADVILLFTDGEPRARKRKWVEEQKQLADNCSNSLKNEKDVKIIGLAVGTPTVVNNFLPYIRRWSSEGSVFNAKVDELDNVISKLVADTCENAGRF